VAAGTGSGGPAATYLVTAAPGGATCTVTGASGKTGSRVVQEAMARGMAVRAILRADSAVPAGLAGADLLRLDLSDRLALKAALSDCEALVIATGARPSADLLGPLKVDALAMRDQLAACREAGVKRVVLVSALCSGRWLHPLNLFGLILVWKGLGEHWLAESGLDWTVVRPGGLTETEHDLDQQGILYSGPGQQQSKSIPRRLVARVCLDALDNPAAIGRIVEVTSSPSQRQQPLAAWLAS
jgi:uncharacterized protein YbjT (DUF2867 family)